MWFGRGPDRPQSVTAGRERFSRNHGNVGSLIPGEIEPEFQTDDMPALQPVKAISSCKSNPTPCPEATRFLLAKDVVVGKHLMVYRCRRTTDGPALVG